MRCGVCVLAGTHEGVGALEPDTYRRLVGDLRAAGVRVVIDLTGEELACALESAPDLVKVSDEDMRADGRLAGDSDADLERLVEALHDDGAERVVVSRAEAPALASDGIAARRARLAEARRGRLAGRRRLDDRCPGCGPRAGARLGRDAPARVGSGRGQRDAPRLRAAAAQTRSSSSQSASRSSRR